MVDAATVGFTGLRRDTPVVLVAKSSEDAATLLAELADDPRVAMCHIDLGDGGTSCRIGATVTEDRTAAQGKPVPVESLLERGCIRD